MKQCSHCKKIKSSFSFPKNKNRKDGLSHSCKECENRRNGILRDKPENRYQVYQNRAKKRKYKFILPFEDFMGFWKKPCYYCGNQIETIGLDRKNNHKGYFLNNIVSCCWRCNKLKGRWCTNDFLKAIKEIYQNYFIKNQS